MRSKTLAAMVDQKALVLGADDRIILSVIRSLGRGGVQVHTAWNESKSLAIHSRYLYKAHDIPKFDLNNPAWKQALCELMKREKFDLVIPCTDLEIIACQTNRAELEAYGRLYLISDEAFEILFDKFKTNELARSVGVRVPREILVTRMDQVEQILSQFEWPIVLKPRKSCNIANPKDWHQVQKAYNEKELKQSLSKMLQVGAIAVQENFVGQGVGVELLLKNGRPLLTFQHLRVHEPLHGGPSSYRKSMAVTSELFDASLKILRPLRYTGVAMVEFKVNPKTKEWIFIEVNPRFWGSLPLAVASGADFPLMLFQMLVDGGESFLPKYHEGIYGRNLYLDLKWQKENLTADHSEPTLATQRISTVIGETFVNIISLKERSDLLTLDDPKPGLAEFRDIALWTFKKLLRK
jgi:predicted ATP-grasp superfamily ATP-dependent carboligase